ncbi:hypothetical protein BMF94_7092 [Rhodotorula taiwanensis]|uniref:Fe2OG dioxygenase domain-containing protein n=1 Tax=Rhodotorula taiwanensis TaxID=741276 RepID=A0A2S5AZE3_9BASI|nr:hypothetical protein BMF94_7092 [Rhodotorula taiwanensis]
MTGDTEAIDTLQELFPQRSRTDLERYLAASQQNLERAFQAIDRGLLDDARPKKRARTRRGSNGLAARIGKRDGVTTDAGVLVLNDSDDEVQLSGPAAVFPGELDRTRSAPAKPVRSAYELLKPAERPTQPEPPVATHVNLPPLTLRTSDMVAKHTKGLVTLVENALPQELASRLYVKMVKESLGEGEGDKPWQPNKWYLVDREVTSPHTSCFYRSLPEQITAQSGYDAAGFDESATYWYNGAKRTARPFTSDQEEARLLVREFVRVLLEGRERHPLEYEGEWDPNVAVANCYRGSKESVGFHSDVLQYLGPFPTIASLTLGCTRPFRLRPFIPSGSGATEAVPPPEIRTLDIVLPHNSLLIMHAGCQERYKHAVPPVNGMDVFRLPRTSLEVSDCFSEEEKEVLLARKWNERINMTFRHYRPDFAPRTLTSPPGYVGTPRCACGVPCTLRPDGRGRVKASLSARSDARPRDDPAGQLFFWVCNAGASNEGKTCGHFKLLDMEKEGRGAWFRPSEPEPAN